MASYGRIAKIGIIWSYLSKGINELIAIPTAMILARLLTPQEFGIAATAAFFIQISQRLTNFGFNTSLIQVRELTEQHKATVFTINVLLGISGWLLLTVSAPWLGTFFKSDAAAAVIPLAAVTFAVGSIGAVSSALIVREMRYRTAVGLDWLYSGISVTGVLLAWYGYSYWSLIVAQVIATTVLALARLVAGGWFPWLSLSTRTMRELLSYGLGLHMKRLLDSGAQNVDNLVIARTLGMDALGLYDKAFTMMLRAVSLLSSAGPAVSFRIFALIHDDHERFRNAYKRVILTSTLISFPVLACLAFVAADLIFVMFGSQWSAAVTPFRLLCAVAMMQITNAYASTVMQSKGLSWGEVWRQAVYLVLIVVGVWIGSRWGLAGAAGSVLVANVVMTFLMQNLVVRSTDLSWTDMVTPHLPGVTCGIVLLGVLLPVRPVLMVIRQVPPSPLELLTYCAVLACATWVVFVRFAPFRILRAVIAETGSDLGPFASKLLGSSREPS